MATAKKKKPKKSRKSLLIVVVVLVAMLALAGYMVLGPATGFSERDRFFYVRTGSSYGELKNELQKQGILKNVFFFDLLAGVAKLPAHVHPGKYKISSLMSNYQLVRMLRSGRQVQVNLVINKLRTKNDLITLMSGNLEADSNALRHLLSDPVFLARYGLDTNTVMCLIVPNTYFFKWNTPAEKALVKLADNYTRFWDENRRKAAQAHGLTPVKAIIVASIVDEETNIQDDKPKIASVYLNRLDKGMKLQADPTVKFGIGDFSIKRITGAMLQNTSPYNTYMYQGLPPGPICTPSAGSIEAVLQAPKTTYLYFCAKEDFSGYSNFASTFDEQLKNAHKYQQALNARGIH